MSTIAGRLSAAEVDFLAQCEDTIQAGLHTFVEVGTALAAVRDNRLYRAEHGTFDDYCAKRWGFTDRRARQLIEAAEIGNMFPVGNSRQAAELARVPEEKRAEVWAETVERTDGKPTAAAIRQTAKQTPARPDLAPSNLPESEVTAAGEPVQREGAASQGWAATSTEEVAPAAGGREDGVTSSTELPAGPASPSRASGGSAPDRPGLESDEDRRDREHREAIERDRDRLRMVIDGWPTMRNSILPGAPEADEILAALGEGDRLAIKQIISEVTGA